MALIISDSTATAFHHERSQTEWMTVCAKSAIVASKMSFEVRRMGWMCVEKMLRNGIDNKKKQLLSINHGGKAYYN